MAYTRGRCTNVDYCTLADSKRDIEVPVGQDFICPECARPLRPPPAGETGSSLNLALIGGGAALVLIGLGIYAGYTLSTGSAPRAPAKVAQATAPAAPHAGNGAAVGAATPPAPQVAPAAAPAPAPEQTVLLRLAGPASLAPVAMTRLAGAYLAYLGDTGLTVRSTDTPDQSLVTGQRLSRPEAIAILARPGAEGDDAAFTALRQGDADAVLSLRRINQQELDGLRKLGDMTAPASEHAIGFQAEAIIVNTVNPLTRLTLAQLRGILAGTINTWPALGGLGRNIHLLREPGDPSLADLVPGAPARSPVEHVVREAAAAVADDTDAMAIVPLNRASQGKLIAIAATGAQPAMPTPANISTEEYPLARRVYLYTPAGSSDPFVPRFGAYAASAEGQSTIGQSGLVPLKYVAPAAPAPLTPKERYKQLVSGAQRLAADLHFEANSNKLDLRSARDVDRVWNLMMSDHTPSSHLILIGFADNQGTPEANMAIATKRAQAVAEVFARRGLPPGQVISFGSDLPIADNSTEEGRQKNRRVEVFLRP
jgi:phosphate transport system substrate-binding protein